MADVVTFDPINLRVVEINSGLSTNTLSLVEIYSEWKDWVLADYTRLGYPPLFGYNRVIGGDPTSDTEALGTAFFWNYAQGWRFRPAEYSHRVTIVGDLYTDPPDQDILAETLGGYAVLVAYQFSTTIRDSKTATSSVVQAVEDWGVINFAK